MDSANVKRGGEDFIGRRDWGGGEWGGKLLLRFLRRVRLIVRIFGFRPKGVCSGTTRKAEYLTLKQSTVVPCQPLSLLPLLPLLLLVLWLRG